MSSAPTTGDYTKRKKKTKINQTPPALRRGTKQQENENTNYNILVIAFNSVFLNPFLLDRQSVNGVDWVANLAGKTANEAM